jgi:hypothetical protein
MIVFAKFGHCARCRNFVPSIIVAAIVSLAGCNSDEPKAVPELPAPIPYVQLDPETKRLPDDFSAADPLEVLDLFGSILDRSPFRIDEYSDQKEIERFEQSVRELFKDKEKDQVPFPGKCKSFYAPNSGGMYVASESVGGTTPLLTEGLPRVRVYSESEWYRPAAGDDEIVGYDFNVLLRKMTPDEARTFHSHTRIRCLFFLEPRYPYISGVGVEMFPSVDDGGKLKFEVKTPLPIINLRLRPGEDTYFLHGFISAIWIYDETTGEIFRKIKVGRADSN